MKQGNTVRSISGGIAAVAMIAAWATSASAAPSKPVVAGPPAETAAAPAPASSPTAAPAPGASNAPPPAPAELPPPPEPVMPWSLGDARALLGVIERIDEEGLRPEDYQAAELRALLQTASNGPAAPAYDAVRLDEVASKSFAWLAEDLRDGRTPMTARQQWFVVDPDLDANPTPALMAKALESHDVAGVLAGLAPTYPDYQILKSALAVTSRAQKAKRTLIAANMDRWRWLPRELGVLFLITNVPEYQLRLATNNKIVRTYRTIVGKPGKTATPQLAAKVENVVFNPTWTVPQSIVVGEGLGARLIRNPAAALRQGYKVSRAKNGVITVVQQPGPNNSLGVMKIDMPNPHAIYLHDTPNHALFNTVNRAYSHGCVRTERAQELGMTMAILGADLTPEQGVEHALSGEYTKVPMTKTFPVYITYFTVAQDITGKLSTFTDIYGRDTPLLASFDKPRELKTGQRSSTEAIIKLDNPL